MRNLILIFSFLIYWTNTNGQTNIYGTNQILYYYSHTDFNKIDTADFCPPLQNHFSPEKCSCAPLQNHFSHEKCSFTPLQNHFSPEKCFCASLQKYFSPEECSCARLHNHFSPEKCSFAPMQNSIFTLRKAYSTNKE